MTDHLIPGPVVIEARVRAAVLNKILEELRERTAPADSELSGMFHLAAGSRLRPNLMKIG